MILHLSLERINSGETPYQVEPTEQNGFYQFFTDGGVHYSVGFMEDDVLLSKNSYQLIIANINNHKSPRDRKVRDTIVSIVDEFFRCNNSTLLYICETGDNPTNQTPLPVCCLHYTQHTYHLPTNRY